VEFWLARDLQHLLGCAEWRNFTAVIIKAKTACEVSRHAVSDHFVDVNKMVDLGSGTQREFATEITIINTREHGLATENAISREHITNNQAVRKTLLERGIRPESLPAALRREKGRTSPYLGGQEGPQESRHARLVE